jgi:uncharacterized protein (UPF0218 family)
VADVALQLPEALRSELKEPLGHIHEDAESLLAAAGRPVVAVGDIVTYHLLEADHTPHVALIDERTERTAVDDAVLAAIEGFDREVRIENPAGSISEGLLDALAEAVRHDGTTLIRVDGEEDLAALPAVIATPPAATVVYGQPGEGMVRVHTDGDARGRVRELIDAMDGDGDAALARFCAGD